MQSLVSGCLSYFSPLLFTHFFSFCFVCLNLLFFTAAAAAFFSSVADKCVSSFSLEAVICGLWSTANHSLTHFVAHFYVCVFVFVKSLLPDFVIICCTCLLAFSGTRPVLNFSSKLVSNFAGKMIFVNRNCGHHYYLLSNTIGNLANIFSVLMSSF